MVDKGQRSYTETQTAKQGEISCEKKKTKGVRQDNKVIKLERCTHKKAGLGKLIWIKTERWECKGDGTDWKWERIKEWSDVMTEGEKAERRGRRKRLMELVGLKWWNGFRQENRQTLEQKWDSCIMFKIADQIISVWLFISPSDSNSSQGATLMKWKRKKQFNKVLLRNKYFSLSSPAFNSLPHLIHSSFTGNELCWS